MQLAAFLFFSCHSSNFIDDPISAKYSSLELAKRLKISQHCKYFLQNNDTSSLMNDSIYDNVCDAIKQPPKLLVSRLNDAEDSNSSVAIVNSLDANTVSTNQNNNAYLWICDNFVLMTGSYKPPNQRPFKPIPIIFFHLNLLTSLKKSFKFPVKISSSGEIHTDGSTGVRTPPPPSPRSNLEKQPPSTVLTSDLFAFSAGRVPQRAESCEELDVAFTEQTNEELYSQKKQKAELFVISHFLLIGNLMASLQIQNKNFSASAAF
ncbi:unnamed protein product [Thelazia callipaeda]|uniref:Uncharacterized protein n=1 Tax=Thelazia callipaeda TaxID=103827 RepID=A0A0N5D4Q7_THECL|nr:unnamed protein product [Thelazia callipaeda]